MQVPKVLLERRSKTKEKTNEIINALKDKGADEIVDENACVYATGSLGRGEMSERSDLDIFVLRDGKASPSLTNLEAIRLKARLIEAARERGYPDFSGDGKYIAAHDLSTDVIAKLGTSEDDYANVFTARMLLILESCPIVGDVFYKRAIGEVIAVYWRDYSQNSMSFLPVFLLNDILRFWKTLCLNYEERTAGAILDNPGKRRLHNYKLKHSRLLTCYSAVTCLQSILKRDKGTVSPEAVMDMVRWTPTERLEKVAEIDQSLAPRVQSILEKYAKFLELSDKETESLATQFGDPAFKRARFDEARAFGDDVFKLIHELGTGTDLLRYLVV